MQVSCTIARILPAQVKSTSNVIASHSTRACAQPGTLHKLNAERPRPHVSQLELLVDQEGADRERHRHRDGLSDAPYCN